MFALIILKQEVNKLIDHVSYIISNKIFYTAINNNLHYCS